MYPPPPYGVLPQLPIDRFAAKVQLLDHSGERLQWVSGADAQQMLSEELAEIKGRRRDKIFAITVRMADVPINRRIPVRVPGAGSAHRRDTYFNPRGVFTIDRIPPSTREMYSDVVTSCLKEAA